MIAGAPLVEVEHLVVEFRSGGGLLQPPHTVRAVDGVSMNVARGETLGLVGESGSGKTTLGRAILRLVAASAGTVRFDGMDVFRLDPPALRALPRA
jgi:ABC-type oligopeptide transport system ATPase subunit